MRKLIEKKIELLDFKNTFKIFCHYLSQHQMLQLHDLVIQKCVQILIAPRPKKICEIKILFV